MRFVPTLVPDEGAKMRRFVEMLPPNYRAAVRAATSLDKAFEIDRQIEGDFSQYRNSGQAQNSSGQKRS